MFVTNVLLKKAKSKYLLVMMQSAVSGHTFNHVRLRSTEKMEMIRYDPLVRTPVVYRELKKLHGVK